MDDFTWKTVETGLECDDVDGIPRENDLETTIGLAVLESRIRQNAGFCHI